MAFADYVKSLLLSDISSITHNPALFVNNPGRDFTRNRKIPMQNLLEFYICMESGNLQHELLKYFNFRSDTASVSAFHQQRSKLKPETFLFLLKQFNRHFRPKTYKESYRLIACDGSVESLIGSFLLPVRPGRKYERRKRLQPPARFAYRFI